MSTNKTANYNLHSWVPGDDFLRAEFNENFALIDGALGEMPRNKKLRMVAGSYLGTSGTQTIELPFAPKALLIASKTYMSEAAVALVLPGVENSCAVLEGAAFTVSKELNVHPEGSISIMSGKGLNPYTYLAVGWED